VEAGVASTSAEPSVRAILEQAAGRSALHASRSCSQATASPQKPAPDIYLLALEKLGVAPDGVLVIEDSRNGLEAARGAGLRCLITSTVTRLTRTSARRCWWSRRWVTPEGRGAW